MKVHAALRITITQTLHLFTAARMRGVLLFIMLLASTSNQHPIRLVDTYELVYETDGNTEMTGSITMYCHTSTTAENIPIREVKFWFNQSVLQDQTDIKLDDKSINFNLTRSHEGYYRCSRHSNDMESCPKKLIICKCTCINETMH